MTAMSWRHWLLIAIPVAALAGFWLAGPIAQPPGYHLFADARSCLGVPNAANVVSNGAFLVAGLLGLFLCVVRRPGGARVVARRSSNDGGRPTPAAGALYAWIVFFAGVALVCAGSAYYHWGPNDATLVWDRLPMAIGFMALYVATLAEHVDGRLERALLVPAALLGPTTVLYWDMSGDLAFYLALQVQTFASLLAVVAFFPHTHRQKGYLIAAFASYGIAVIFERLDMTLWSATAGAVSGHTIKHLFAAAAAGCIVVMLWRRPPLARGA